MTNACLVKGLIENGMCEKAFLLILWMANTFLGCAIDNVLFFSTKARFSAENTLLSLCLLESPN